MLTTVKLGSFPLERFESILDGEAYERLMERAGQAKDILAGRAIWHVNSTARGGGVAEMLQELLPYARGDGGTSVARARDLPRAAVHGRISLVTARLHWPLSRGCSRAAKGDGL